MADLLVVSSTNLKVKHLFSAYVLLRASVDLLPVYLGRITMCAAKTLYTFFAL